MRDRKEIEDELMLPSSERDAFNDDVILETLLDIRDLLAQKKQ